MTEHKTNVTGAIACNPCEIELLKSVYQLLKDGNVLGTSQSSNIVNFKYPDELKVTPIPLDKLLLYHFDFFVESIQDIIDLKIPAEGVQDPDEIKRICETVIKYSLKTAHPHFHNQLFGGVDPYGLAGSWISDALNTSQ